MQTWGKVGVPAQQTRGQVVLVTADVGGFEPRVQTLSLSHSRYIVT